MGTAMAKLYFTRDHEYLSLEGVVGIVGITDYAQAQLGDVVFVELPAVGAKLEKGAAMAVVESVKAASDVFAPAAGEVIEVNKAVEAQPGLINEAAASQGWLCKLRLDNANAVDGLMDEAAYAEFLTSLG